jgi:hypothetical protein
MTKSHGSNSDACVPPIFEALGIPDTDDSAAELAFCRTLIQAHLRRINKLNSNAVDVLINIANDILEHIEY